MKQYRKIYKEKYGDIGNLHIHHIDHDRNNNDLSNLVALDSKTHHRYHMSKPFYDDNTDDTSYYAKRMREIHIETLKEIELAIINKNLSQEI